MRSADRFGRGRAVLVAGLMLAMPGMAAAQTGGLPVEPPKAIRAHPLTDHHGQPVNFPSATDGRWRLVVFGYTHCPDVCPMTLHKTAQLLQELGADGARLQVVFVSIDSARDDTRAMKSFVEQFDTRITGLTGDPEALQAAANEFGVMTRRYQGKTALAYTMVHSSLLYLLDPAAKVRIVYPGSADAEAVAADLRRLWRVAGSSVSGVLAATR